MAAADDGSPTAAAAAGVDAGAAGGSFLLRIPMEELIGVALEPLLIITVDIDTTHGQVGVIWWFGFTKFEFTICEVARSVHAMLGHDRNHPPRLLVKAG